MHEIICRNENRYNMYNPVSGRFRFSKSLCLGQIINLIKHEYGTKGTSELPNRLKRVHKNGHSGILEGTLNDLVAFNSAGDNGEALPYEEIIKRFLGPIAESESAVDESDDTNGADDVLTKLNSGGFTSLASELNSLHDNIKKIKEMLTNHVKSNTWSDLAVECPVRRAWYNSSRERVYDCLILVDQKRESRSFGTCDERACLGKHWSTFRG